MNKVILVTGAASGIGKAAVAQLVANGHTVYGADIAFSDSGEFQEEGFYPLTMDVTNNNEVLGGVERIMAQEGRIDGLLANAGIASMGVTELISMEDVHKVFNVNLHGVLRCIKAVLPAMRRRAPEGQGTIMVTSSNFGNLSFPGLSTYCASKFALEAMINSLSAEMKAYYPGIKMVTIEPGFIRTELYKSSLGIWLNAMKHPEVKAYQTAMKTLFAEFNGMFKAGASVEDVGKVIARAFETQDPEERYKCGEQIQAKAL